MDDRTETGRAARAAAEEFASGYLAENSRLWEMDRFMPRDMFVCAAEAGLCGLLVPAALGGRGLSNVAFLQVLEVLARADMAAAFALVVHNNHARAIVSAGTEQHIESYLAEMIAGRTIGAFLLTEPGGGSDAAALTTRAIRDGNDYIVNGEKAWITNTPHADLLNVFAQTKPGSGAAGILSIQVDADTPGITRLPAYDMLGGYAIGAGGFTLEDVRVPASQVLVPPGQGFRAAMAGIDIARAGVAAMCAGMLQAGLDTAMPWIARREAFGRPLADQQGLMWQLADVATDLEAARLLAYTAARRIDEEGTAAVAAAHAKKFATRAAFDGLSACMQAMGADGLKQDHPLARHLAAAKMAHYLDGTTEIQNVVISRALKTAYANAG